MTGGPVERRHVPVITAVCASAVGIATWIQTESILFSIAGALVAGALIGSYWARRTRE